MVAKTIRWVVVVWCCMLVSAQITFSRDWSGGKRAAPSKALDCDYFTRLCLHFVNDLEQSISKETKKNRHRITNFAEENQLGFDEDN